MNDTGGTNLDEDPLQILEIRACNAHTSSFTAGFEAKEGFGWANEWPLVSLRLGRRRPSWLLSGEWTGFQISYSKNISKLIFLIFLNAKFANFESLRRISSLGFW